MYLCVLSQSHFQINLGIFKQNGPCKLCKNNFGLGLLFVQKQIHKEKFHKHDATHFSL